MFASHKSSGIYCFFYFNSVTLYIYNTDTDTNSKEDLFP